MSGTGSPSLAERAQQPLEPEVQILGAISSQMYIGEGGQQLVVDLAHLPLGWETNIALPAVRKIDHHSIIRVSEDPALYTEQLATMRARGQRRRDRYAQLREIFGSNRVPSAEFGIVKIEGSRETVRRLVPDLDFQEERLIMLGLECVQEYVPELSPSNIDDHFSLSMPYAEKYEDAPDATTYQSVNEAFVIAPQETRLSNDLIAQFLAVQRSAHLERLLAAAADNPIIRNELTELTNLFIEFSTLTNQTLDLVGDYNVLVTNEGESKLIDALMPRNVPLLITFGELIHKINADMPLTITEKRQVLNARGYICTVNFLAGYFGLSERLQVRGITELSGSDWDKALQMMRMM